MNSTDVSREAAKRTERIAMVIAEAERVLGTESVAKAWLHSPLKALDGDTPISRLGTERGIERVLEILSGVEHGVYV